MPKRPNHDGSIGRYKDGWRAQYTDPVTRKQKALYAKTQAEAARKLREKLAEIQRGAHVPTDRLTTGAGLEQWFFTYYHPTVKASTAATTFTNLRKLIAGIGAVQLQRLEAGHIQAFIAEQQRQGISPNTIKRYLKVLGQALKQAVLLRKINNNPMEAVHAPPMEKPEIEFLTRDEQRALLAALPETTHGLAIRFLLGTGLRASELCGLLWKDVKADGLHVERNYLMVKSLDTGKYTGVYSTPKTEVGKRIIPLHPTLCALLDAQRDIQQQNCTKCGTAWAGPQPGTGECPIFSSMLGTPMDRSNLDRSFDRFLQQANLRHRGVHALRHTFATNWVHSGAEIVTLSRILGHADAAFTYKTYCHTNLDAMTQGMANMEQFL